MPCSNPDQMWVFAYGSLIWNPDFPIAETRLAIAQGWRRSFCMWSVHYRGTAANPGLVLALEHAPQARCAGLAYRVRPGAEAETLGLLRARELVSSAYIETSLPLETALGDVSALAYVIDPEHSQYSGALPLVHQAQIIAKAEGARGRNCDYLWATADHLRALGIEDPELDTLSDLVRDFAVKQP